MPICGNCGTELAEGTGFCSNCGGPQEQSDVRLQSTARTPTGGAQPRSRLDDLKDRSKRAVAAARDSYKEQQQQRNEQARQPLQVVRQYEARKSGKVSGQFQHDQIRMAKQGYEVVSQTVIPRHVGCLRTILTLGMAAGKSTLVVTYKLHSPDVLMAVPSVAAAPPTSASDEIEKLAALRDKGVLTEEEFTAKKRQLLGL